jgi:hypothetical protein
MTMGTATTAKAKAPARERTILQWDRAAQADRDLVQELRKYQARSRGSRLKYLARLGLLAESQGALLEGRTASGRLILPVTAVAPMPTAHIPVTTGAPELGLSLDAMLDGMEEL